MSNEHVRIAIFVSGAGSNAANIANYFQEHARIEVAVFITNNSQSGILAFADENSIPCLLIETEDLINPGELIDTLSNENIEFIVLAGFLKKIPDEIVAMYRNRILNIHPALLPKHGGPGMYGRHVHQAVLDSGEKKSGITIHLVDEVYDHGKVIFQKVLDLQGNETVSELEMKIKALEHENFPIVIEKFILDTLISKPDTRNN